MFDKNIVLSMYKEHLDILLMRQRDAKISESFELLFKIDSVKYIIGLIEEDIKKNCEVHDELYK